MFGRPKRNISLYAKLGLTKQASESDIQRAYSQLVEKYTKEKENKRISKKKFDEIKRAYKVLSDSKTRAEYDKHGSVGRWVRIKQAFSPENLDENSSIIRDVWSCFFYATCCCFGFCCGHCCGCCQCNDVGVDDEEEIYVKETFSDYLADGSDTGCSSTCCGRGRRRREKREAARRRRHAYFQHKHEMKKKKQPPSSVAKTDEQNAKVAPQSGEDEDLSTVTDRDSTSVPSRNTRNWLMRRDDSGYGVGFTNKSFEEDDDDRNDGNDDHVDNDADNDAGISEDHDCDDGVCNDLTIAMGSDEEGSPSSTTNANEPERQHRDPSSEIRCAAQIHARTATNSKELPDDRYDVDAAHSDFANQTKTDNVKLKDESHSASDTCLSTNINSR